VRCKPSRPRGPRGRHADRVGSVFRRTASLRDRSSCHRTPGAPVAPDDSTTAATTKSRKRCIGKLSILLMRTLTRSHACGPQARRSVPKGGDLPAARGSTFQGRPSHRPSRGRRRRRIGGMPILTESEVAKSRRQAHDNDACGFAHGTIAHRGMHPCHAAKLRRDRALRDQRRDGDERGTVMRGVMSGTGGPISGEGCWLRPDQWRTWCYGIFRCRVPAGRAREARHVFTSGVMTIDA
jgi:hypothetical protein